MKPKTLRTYVWLFCLFVFMSAQGIFYRRPINAQSFSGRSLTTIMSATLQACAICWLFSLFTEFRNVADRWIITLTAAGCASKLFFDLHRLDYISFGTPYWLTVFFILAATAVFAFRIDSLLKKHDIQIEAIGPLSETSEGE